MNEQQTAIIVEQLISIIKKVDDRITKLEIQVKRDVIGIVGCLAFIIVILLGLIVLFRIKT